MRAKTLKLIQPVSKRDQVVASFKEAILSGVIRPGDPIVESKVAQQLGAGIPLVREALIELEQQGYVQKVPYKGTTVTKLERREVEQLFRLRAELETLALEWGQAVVTTADLHYLQTIAGNMKRAAEALDLDQFYENDLIFHRKLWALSGNRYLEECLERLIVPLFAFFVMQNRRERESYLASAAAHEKIVEALPQLSKAKLRALVRDSLADWQTQVLDELLKSDAE
jgi:DNA-binding GntR family transcriptional regulator